MSPITSATSVPRITRRRPIRSCARCRARRVQCDRSHPCANCAKANVPCYQDSRSVIGSRPIERVDTRIRLQNLERVVQQLVEQRQSNSVELSIPSAAVDKALEEGSSRSKGGMVLPTGPGIAYFGPVSWAAMAGEVSLLVAQECSGLINSVGRYPPPTRAAQNLNRV